MSTATLPSPAGLATPALYATGGGGSQQFATPLPQDRLIRKEVSLGLVREIVPPQNHIVLGTYCSAHGALRLMMSFSSTRRVLLMVFLLLAPRMPSLSFRSVTTRSCRKAARLLSTGQSRIITRASDVNRYREWLLIQQTDS
jgi:hypothetical protein